MQVNVVNHIVPKAESRKPKAESRKPHRLSTRTQLFHLFARCPSPVQLEKRDAVAGRRPTQQFKQTQDIETWLNARTDLAECGCLAPTPTLQLGKPPETVLQLCTG